MLLPTLIAAGGGGVHTTLLIVPASALGAQVAPVAVDWPTFVQVRVSPV